MPKPLWILWDEYEAMHFHWTEDGRSCLAYAWNDFLPGTTLDVIEEWFEHKGFDIKNRQ